MESLAVQAPRSDFAVARFSYTKIDVNALVVRDSLGGKEDSVDVGINDLYKGLTVTAKEILSKINELLKKRYPQGVHALKPEDATPEATADRIVKGITGLWGGFKDQNPDLSDEELLNQFMDKVRSGVEQGYGSAVSTLKDIGAFQFDGIEAGVARTKELIDQKLKAFEAEMRKQLGLPTDDTQQQTADLVESELLTQGGATLNIVA